MIGLVVLVKVDLEARVNNMRYRDYGELLEDQIAEMKMRLRAYREGQRDNRARLAKQHGVKFVDPSKTKEKVIMTTKQFIYVLGGLLQLGYTEMRKLDNSIVVSGVDVPTREFMVSDDILEFVPEHGSIARALSQDYALETVKLGLELIQNFPEYKKIKTMIFELFVFSDDIRKVEFSGEENKEKKEKTSEKTDEKSKETSKNNSSSKKNSNKNNRE